MDKCHLCGAPWVQHRPDCLIRIASEHAEADARARDIKIDDTVPEIRVIWVKEGRCADVTFDTYLTMLDADLRDTAVRFLSLREREAIARKRARAS